MPIPLGVISFCAVLAGRFGLPVLGMLPKEWIRRRPAGSPARSAPRAVRDTLA